MKNFYDLNVNESAVTHVSLEFNLKNKSPSLNLENK